MNLCELTERVAQSLGGAGFAKQAEEIQDLCCIAMNQDLSVTERKEALKQIEMRCHIRWLGDLYIPGFSLQEWWGQLEKLSKATKKFSQRENADIHDTEIRVDLDFLDRS